METSERSPIANGLKRRQSEDELPEQESKRPRVSPGKSSPIPPDGEETGDKRDTPIEAKKVEDKPAPQQPTRKKSVVTDEKQRSKRLFGALLGNLNQPSDRTSKRRQEIESRRKAELQRQDDERIEDKQRRIEKLLQRRKVEQKSVDEQNLRIRHSNLLNTANFLQTATEPRLYYRPWELRPDEEDRIDDQIAEAKALIKKELAGSNDEDTDDLKSTVLHNDTAAIDQTNSKPPESDDANDDLPGATSAQAKPSRDDEDQVPAKSDEVDSEAKPAEVPDSDPANHSNGNDDHVTADADVMKSNEIEEDGDHVVEGDEDTVVY